MFHITAKRNQQKHLSSKILKSFSKRSRIREFGLVERHISSWALRHDLDMFRGSQILTKTCQRFSQTSSTKKTSKNDHKNHEKITEEGRGGFCGHFSKISSAAQKSSKMPASSCEAAAPAVAAVVGRGEPPRCWPTCSCVYSIALLRTTRGGKRGRRTDVWAYVPVK